MCKKFVVLLVVFGMVFLSSLVLAADDSELILKILVKKGIVTQQEVDEMRSEIAKERPVIKAEAPKSLEDRVAAVEKDILSKVGLDKISSRLKIKGRFAAGYFKSEKQGSFPAGSFQAPEAKLQFAFQPDDINTVIMRLNLNNAVFNNVDYLYLDTNIMKLTPWEKSPFTLTSRIGRFKTDFGEETWSNNPVESILPSNSAANVAGTDEGLQLSGKIGKQNPLGWSAAVMNGNSGTGADNNFLKAFNAKIYYNVIDPLYVSASYYNSGRLDTASSEMSIGGITAPPTNARAWIRQIAEVDVRYDFKKGKTQNPPAYCDSLAFVRFAYGHFYDEAKYLNREFAVQDREGNYGYAEGLYNITKKLYAAARASVVGLNDEANKASWNSVTASNRYERYSLGLGYRLTSAMTLKGSYDINLERKTGANNPKDSLLSLLIAGQF